MDLSGKKATILGMSKVGLEAAHLLRELGAEVFFSEIKNEKLCNPAAEEFKKYKFKYETGGHSEYAITDIDIIIKSPGVPSEISIIKQAISNGIPVLGEMEFAFRYCKKPIIAVTGTNGKSSTVSLINSIMLFAGKASVIAGHHMGWPLSKIVKDDIAGDYIIAEMGVTDLTDIDKFHPKIAVITNIVSDHLVRFNNLENYLKTKMRIFQNLDSKDCSILNSDDEILKNIKIGNDLDLRVFSTGFVTQNGICISERGEIIEINGNDTNIVLKKSEIPKTEFLENVLAAIAVCRALNISCLDIKNGLRQYKGLSHRVELVNKKGSCFIYNDAKATNPQATSKSFKKVLEEKNGNKQIILIMGGREKLLDYQMVIDELKENIKKIFIYSSPVAERMEEIFVNIGVKAEIVEGFDNCVYAAINFCVPGDTIMLSPGTSVDETQYRDAYYLGTAFKEIIIKKEKAGSLC
ncbi:MAG: UDP-N-acetylmuramoyl-L-alanine--D-glutamate ligase [Candidatus Theseobacter exili]|nr:UDP-N-acetylmuramoyl-L-alanine--D-glutamate ligase [Candidatus Theseobacter exili]